ncbi:MAG: hypothetical protein P8J52_06735 [Gammaproteobacteria bacterium]|nr:hypothetical protein [Gammaproteobacteria bacterium]
MLNLRFYVAIFVSLSFSTLAFSQVGIKYDINASNPLAVVAAMDKFYSSPTGQAASGSVTLYQYMANGDNPATHAFLVSFPNLEEMQQTFTRNALSQDWASFLAELNMASDQIDSVMYRATGISGGDPSKVTSPNTANYWIYLNVSDPATYASAWQTLTNKNDDLDVASGLSEILADGASNVTHVIAQRANDLPSLLGRTNSQLVGWDDFVEAVSSIRTVVSRDMLGQVKTWSASN